MSARAITQSTQYGGLKASEVDDETESERHDEPDPGELDVDASHRVCGGPQKRLRVLIHLRTLRRRVTAHGSFSSSL